MWPSMRLRRGYAPAGGSPCAFGGAMPPQVAPRAAYGHGRGKPLPACAAPHPRPPAQAQGTLHPAGSSEQARQKSSGPLSRLWVLGALRLRLGGRHAVPAGAPPPAPRCPRHAVPAGAIAPPLVRVPPFMPTAGAAAPPLSRVPPGAPGGAPKQPRTPALCLLQKVLNSSGRSRSRNRAGEGRN
jgi:hypothetical protein